MQPGCIGGERQKMRRSIYLLFMGGLLLSLGSTNAFGQATASATIQGTITDKSGAVVSGAEVVAKNKATDITRTTSSDDTGSYRFELLPAGTYTVTVTKTGFGPVAQTIEILVGQTATVNAELKPGAARQLPLEAVQEFQISTQRFYAVNGRSEGAAINMITKSGTNVYHGSIFGYFRDTNLNTDEKDPTGVGPTPAHPDGTIPSHPDYSRQQFGGSIGGPFRKDKLFGFAAIEREREHQAQTVDATSLTELTLAKAHGFADQPAATIPRPFFEWRYNGRLDWVINSKNSAYVSYTSQVNDSLNDQSDATMDLTEGNYTRNHLIVGNFTLNSNLSNTTINQFTLG